MGNYSDQFATALDQALGVPDTAAAHQFYAAWAQAEGGSATYNPFNTTQGTQTKNGQLIFDATGATNYNKVGVKNYTSFQQGVAATATTLKNGLYQPILAALGSGQATPMQLAQAEAQTPWGTGTLIEKVLGGPSNGQAPAAGGTVVAASSAQPVGLFGIGGGDWYNPFSWGGSAPLGAFDPLNWPAELGQTAEGAASAVGGPIVAGIGKIISSIIAPFEKYLEDAALVLFGAILTIVGLIMLGHAASNSGGGATAGGGGGGDKDEKEDEGGEAAGGEAAEAAVLA